MTWLSSRLARGGGRQPLDLVHKFGRGGPVGRVVAPVGVQEAPVGGENEIPAELEHVFPGLPAVRPPAGKDQTQVSREHVPTEEHRPPPAIQAEVAVGRSVGVTHRRQGERCGGHCLGPRLSDDQHIHPGLSDRIEMVPHLHEVRQAGDSTQVAEKHEHQWPRKLGEADRGAVGAKERQVGHMVTNTRTGHHISSGGYSPKSQPTTEGGKKRSLSFTLLPGATLNRLTYFTLILLPAC